MEEKRNVIGIAATVPKHKCIGPELLAVHTLTGCDITFFWGVSKATAQSTIENDTSLHNLGMMCDLNAVIEATKFIATCYGSKEVSDMSAARYQIW